MSPTSRTYTNADLGTVLYTALNAVTSATGDSMTLPADSGLPSTYPYRVLLEWGTSNWEVIQVNSLTSYNSASNTNTYGVTRDVDNESIRTTSPSHAANVPVIQGVSAQDFIDANAAAVIVGSYPAASAGYTLVTQTTGVPVWQAIPAATVPVTFSAALSAGSLVLIKNTTAAPTQANLLIQAQAAADKSFGIYVGGDTAYRFLIDSNGKHQWGSGSATYDLDLYRASAGVLQTDNSLTVSGNLVVGGKITLSSVQTTVASVSAAYTVPSSGNVVLASASSAAFTVTLPAVAAGLHVTVVKTDSSANVVTVAPASGTINGAATYTALSTQYKGAQFVSDGTNWFTESQT